MIMEKYSPDKDCIVMSRDEVRAVDSWAINTLGIHGVVLMENAGRSCAELIKEKLAETNEPRACPPDYSGRRACIFCGT